LIGTTIDTLPTREEGMEVQKFLMNVNTPPLPPWTRIVQKYSQKIDFLTPFKENSEAILRHVSQLLSSILPS